MTQPNGNGTPTDLRTRAAEGDVEAQWELNLQAATAIEITPTCRALPMRKIERRILPGIERRMDMVDPALLDVLRRLATGKERWPLFLSGPSGSGKTATALALCDFAESATYTTAEDLADRIMAGDGDAAWELIAERDLAVLDEIGERQQVGDLAYRAVKKFADIRSTEAGSVAVYISNCQPSEIQSLFDDRVASRLLCGTSFELTGDDRRFTG